MGHVGRPMARAAVGPGGAFTGWASSSRGTVPGASSHLPPEPSPFHPGPTRIALVRLEILGAHAGADHPRALNPSSPRMHQEPVELAAFSKSRSVPNIYDRSQLKRYMRPSVPFDLSEGHATFLDRDRNVPRPASLVPIFESLRVAGLDERELASADVVTWRGNFAKILGTPWNTRDAWHMEAELVHGVAVLNVLEPPAALSREANRRGRDALMAYWGYSFEEACTGGLYDAPIDCLDAFCAVVR